MIQCSPLKLLNNHLKTTPDLNYIFFKTKQNTGDDIVTEVYEGLGFMFRFSFLMLNHQIFPEVSTTFSI